MTARMTAAARAWETARRDGLLRDPWAAALAGDEGFEFLDRQATVVRTLNQPSPYVLRHRFFDDFLLAGLDDGIRQAVLVGAGLDTRGFRLSWPTGARLFEIDQPAVLAYKQRVLDEAGAVAACERRIVALDLRDELAPALLEAGYDSETPSFWLIEGVLFYLPESSVRELLADAARLSPPGSRLGVDLMATSVVRAAAMEPWAEFYAAEGAEFQFICDDPAGLIAEHGWEPTVHTYVEMSEQLGRQWSDEGVPGADGAIIKARRREG
jgi:methyltransferase (TIGR00027 family)